MWVKVMVAEVFGSGQIHRIYHFNGHTHTHIYIYIYSYKVVIYW